MKILSKLPVLRNLMGDSAPVAGPSPHMIVSAERVNGVIALVAFFLPPLLLLVAYLGDNTCYMTSISHYYYTAVGGDILVGGLVTVGLAMILFYVPRPEGTLAPGEKPPPAHQAWSARLATLAGVFALGVAFFPTDGIGCRYADTGEQEVARFLLADTVVTLRPDYPVSDQDPGPDCSGTGDLPADCVIAGTVTADFWKSVAGWDDPKDLRALLYYGHYISAMLLFAILAIFVFAVFPQPQTRYAYVGCDESAPLTPRKTRRNRVYRALGALMLVAMAAIAARMAINTFAVFEGSAARTWIADHWDRSYLTFVFEAMALMSFGAAWAVKAKTFGFLNDTPCPDELAAA